MKTEDLIDQLARDAKPSRTAVLPAVSAALWCAVAGALAVSWALLEFGLRADASTAIATLRWSLCGLGFLALAAVSAFFGLSWSRPGRLVARGARVAYAAALVALGVGIGAYATLPAESFSSGFALSGLACSFVVALLSVVPAAALFVVALRLAPMAPARVGAAIGMASGAIANVGLLLHCPVENATHILIYHAGPVLLLAVVGGLAGARVLRW